MIADACVLRIQLSSCPRNVRARHMRQTRCAHLRSITHTHARSVSHAATVRQKRMRTDADAASQRAVPKQPLCERPKTHTTRESTRNFTARNRTQKNCILLYLALLDRCIHLTCFIFRKDVKNVCYRRISVLIY